MQELLRCVWVLIRCVDANFALAVKTGQKEFDVSPKNLREAKSLSLTGGKNIKKDIKIT